MTSSGTFQQILAEKMAETPSRNQVFSSKEVSTEPAHLAYLMGQIEITRLQKRAPAGLFQPKTKVAPTPRPRAKGPAHALTARQKTAVEWFLSQGERLEDDFTAHELKSAFRRLALRLHPDVALNDGGIFLTLQSHRRALEVVVTTAKKAA